MAFFRPSVLVERLRDLNVKLKSLNAEEIVEVLQPEFFIMLQKQKIYDTGVKLKVLVYEQGNETRRGKRGYAKITDKLQSTTQFFEKEKFEGLGSNDEDRKTTGKKGKRKKAAIIEDKDGLKESLEKQRRSPWIVWGYILAIITSLMGLIVISVVGESVFVLYLSDVEKAYRVENVVLRKIAETMYIKGNIRTVMFINSGEMVVTNQTAAFADRMEDINTSYTDIKTYDTELNKDSIYFASKDEISPYFTIQVPVQMLASGVAATKNYSMPEVNKQIASSVFNILQLGIANFTDTDDEIYFCMSNTLEKSGNYAQHLFDFKQAYKNLAENMSSTASNTHLATFLVGIGFTFACYLIIALLYFKIRKAKLRVVSFFIQISTKSVDEMIASCETFLSNAVFVEADNATVEESEIRTEEDSRRDDEDTGSYVSLFKLNPELRKGYQKHHSHLYKTLTDSFMNVCATMIMFFIQFMVIEAYFMTYFFVGRYFNNTISRAGTQSAKIGTVELDSARLLVLSKESVVLDSGQSSLSSVYTQLMSVLNSTVDLLTTFEDVFPWSCRLNI